MKKFNFKSSLKIVFLFIVLGFSPSYADQTIKSLASNVQIKEINYNPNSIHHYTGYYGYQSSLVFADGEAIGTISMGNSTGWQINPHGNRLFLKPVEENAETNVTIITNKRVYHFAFHAADATGIDDPELAYEVRFKYNSTSVDLNTGFLSPTTKSKSVSDISDADYLNFRYKVSGADYIKPLKVFDDGRFMYLEFRDINADLPAIFLVDSDGYESLINFHVKENYIVVERVAPRFTLRHGSDTVCVFNEKILYQNPEKSNRYIKKSKYSSKTTS